MNSVLTEDHGSCTYEEMQCLFDKILLYKIFIIEKRLMVEDEIHIALRHLFKIQIMIINL